MSATKLCAANSAPDKACGSVYTKVRQNSQLVQDFVGALPVSRSSPHHPLSPDSDLPQIVLPERYNYIAVFVTLACNLRCSYCINWFAGTENSHTMMPGADWLRGLNRLVSRTDLPLSLQGGEPTLHNDFHEIVNGLRADLNIDVLTNLQFDIDRFIAEVPPERIRRDAPYASIRVSYHPEQMELAETKVNVLKLMAAGYSIGIWAVEHPGQIGQIEQAKEECERDGIDFRTKEFLGRHEGKLYGQYKYPDAIKGEVARESVLCRTSELIIGPSGSVYRCHSDLYAGRAPIGNILDESFTIEDVHRPCKIFGLCNPCDIKIKTNRLQQFGHTSVDIQF